MFVHLVRFIVDVFSWVKQNLFLHSANLLFSLLVTIDPLESKLPALLKNLCPVRLLSRDICRIQWWVSGSLNPTSCLWMMISEENCPVEAGPLLIEAGSLKAARIPASCCSLAWLRTFFIVLHSPYPQVSPEECCLLLGKMRKRVKKFEFELFKIWWDQRQLNPVKFSEVHKSIRTLQQPHLFKICGNELELLK